MNLQGKIVTLRPVEEEDLEMLRDLTNDPEFEKMIIGWSFPVSRFEQKRWFENSCNTSTRVRYIIETEQDGAVGMIGLQNINWKDGTADGGGMRIAKKEIRTRGLATDAWMTLLKYTFEELRLNRVNGAALMYNEASKHVCTKVGFIQEGIQRQAIYKGGQYHDVVLYGCLRTDYEKNILENHYWD